MTDRQAYLALEQALIRIAPDADKDPEGHYGTFLSRMDVIRNAFSYGIWESEDPTITLAWKKRIDAMGFQGDEDFGYEFVKGFLETLGRLHGEKPTGPYSEGKILPDDAKWGIDVSGKAARIYSRRLDLAFWKTIANRFEAQETFRECLWFLKNLAKAYPTPMANAAFLSLAKKTEEDFIGYCDLFRDSYPNDLALMAAYLKDDGILDAATLVSRMGKTAFRTIGYYRFPWFDYRNGDKDGQFSVPTDAAALTDDLRQSNPEPAKIGLLLALGYGLSFVWEDTAYLAFDPLPEGPALILTPKPDGGYRRLDYCTIDGLLTQPRFHSDSHQKGLPLVKAIREAHDIQVLSIDSVLSISSSVLPTRR